MSYHLEIINQLAQELAVKQAQIEATVQLLDEGATVPFIARYRKEATGGLDDSQLRLLEERLEYLRDLQARKTTVLDSIRKQDKLSADLETKILACNNKQTLEDLYLPFKPKRKTRAHMAREAGLQPLADGILNTLDCNPAVWAEQFINPEAGFNNSAEVLNGVRDILSEQWAEQADLLERIRTHLLEHGVIAAFKTSTNDTPESLKFKDYFDYHEPLKKVASHRMLAMLRGRDQEVLGLNIDLPEALESKDNKLRHPFEITIANFLKLSAHGTRTTPRLEFLEMVCRWAWKVKIAPRLETELLTSLRETAEAEAIAVFGRNLKDLLLAAPAGTKATLGLDPGIRTGVKVAVVSVTGQVLETTTIYPHEPRKDWHGSQATLAHLCQKHAVSLIAIGNGTASRETEQLVKEMLNQHKDLKATPCMVSEAGASVYSASELASNELPHLDVSLRGAVSIARRLQDPLAELVKIDPKSIGVGQYQHDVNQRRLSDKLDAVVEDCVNAVGVELNTASEALLTHVSGLNSNLAKSLIDYRNQHGPFKSRKELLKVPKLGQKTFELAAGFLRINHADNPLDQTSVHPEAYALVEAMAQSVKQPVHRLIGQNQTLQQINLKQFVSDQFGLPTLNDILKELEKPGRDPRPSFKTAQFNADIRSINDLKENQILEGVVTNVVNFGAFVDIGVHQDGLVHVSALANQFVKDPHSIVKTGDVVTVKVVSIDLQRQRIGLSMRLTDDAQISNGNTGGQPRSGQRNHPPHSQQRNQQAQKTNPQQADSALAQAFKKATLKH